MKEHEVRLTNQSHVPRLELGGNFMSDATQVEEWLRLNQAPIRLREKPRKESEKAREEKRDEEKKVEKKAHQKPQVTAQQVWERNSDYPWENVRVDIRRILPSGEIEGGGPGAMPIPTVEQVLNMIDSSPVVESSQFDPRLLELASRYREAREYLINRIIFRAFEDTTETNDYRTSMTLYASGHLDYLLGALGRIDPVRYKELQGLQTAAVLFHTMNAKLIEGNLQEFLGTAQALNFKHFGYMRDIRGVPEVMKLFEEKYDEYLARYKRISAQGYEDLKDEVEKAFEMENNQGLVESEFADERTNPTSRNSRKMKDWELQRALNVGRTFFNITLRASEKIASGEVPRETWKGGTGAHKRYASFVQESGAKLMNWIQWTAFRFQIASPRGGVEFLNRSKKNLFEFLRSRGRKLGINKIKEFGGVKTDEIEVGGMFGSSGVYSSWRNENLAFENFKFRYRGGFISIRDFLDEGRRLQDIDEVRTDVDVKNKVDLERRQRKLLEILRPLIEGNSLGLGLLLKQNMFSEAVGYKAREKIWEKVSQENVSLMVNYLTGLKFEGGAGGPIPFERILAQDPLARGWDQARLTLFKNKLIIDQERRLKILSAQFNGRTLNINPVNFTPEEQRLIARVKQEGLKLAPHLADIVFPYVPFMNDVDFSLLDYTGPGNEFYKRRNNDFVSYNKAEAAYTSLMNNPTGQAPDKILGFLDEIIKGIESPNSTGEAQERVFPMYEAWIDMIMTKPGQRQFLVKTIRESVKKPTSIAQKFAGMKALSVDEHQTREIIEQAEQIGIVDPILADEMRKKKNLGLLFILWALFRDFWYVPFVTGTYQFAKATYPGKAA